MKEITMRVDIWYDSMLQESYKRTYYNLTIDQAMFYAAEMGKQYCAAVSDYLASYSLHVENAIE